MGKFSKFLNLAALIAPCLLSPNLYADHDSCSEFHLKDFEGCFASYGYSVGGIGGAGAPANSVSEAHLSQVSWNKHGKGTIHFISNTVWSALGAFTFSNSVAGQPPHQVPVSPDDIHVKLRLTDQRSGSGVIELTNFPTSGAKVANDFVAIKKNGRVVEYFESTIFGSLDDGFTTNVPPTGVSITISKRQNK
jgi:hypothetical protein